VTSACPSPPPPSPTTNASNIKIDLADIDARERVTLHDVKARIEAFNALAGREAIHLGLTSRDLTENVEQLQIARSLGVVRFKTAAALLQLSARAKQFRTLMLTGRTHNVPAQPTTLGKRFAMAGQELLAAFTGLDELAARYPVRGLKGAVGTQLDQFTLFDGDAKKVAKLEARISPTSDSRFRSSPSAKFTRAHSTSKSSARSTRSAPPPPASPPPCASWPARDC